MSRIDRRILVIGCVAALIVIFSSAIVSASTTSNIASASLQGGGVTYNVTVTEDTADSVCDAHCSIREAIIAANASPGSDTVIIPAGTYVLTRHSHDDAALYGDLDVTQSATIIGAGAAST